MTLLHEWPLVFFTLTVQLAVGLHLVLLAATGPLGSVVTAKGANPWGGRPSFLVNGIRLFGAMPLEKFESVIELIKQDDS